MSRMNYRQDMPPQGGYEAFRISRNLPKRGPSGTVTILGGVAVMAFGFYVIKRTNENRRWLARFLYESGSSMFLCAETLLYRVLKREKLEARLALLPLLQAEEDRR